jgi:dipeptidyl aminopeptidase/acylaminoacyl peptidase
VTGAVALSPDGTLAVYAHEVLASAAEGWRVTLRSVGTDGRDDRLLADIAGTDLAEPVVLADGTAVVCVAERMPTPERPPGLTLLRIPLRRDGGRTRARAAGEPEDLLPGFDGFPTNPVGSSDGGAVFFVSNMDGRAPVFRVELATGAVTRLTTEGAYSNLCVAPDGSAVYALRTAVDAPPQPVRLDPARAGQDPVRLPAPGALTGLPGRLEELAVTVEDGRRVRAWLVLPEDAAPRHRAPLLLWVHGGPMSSWNSWTWRWNPWTAAARGYAVLLPDPALSTGYGEAWLAAGWPGWGGAPFTDLMSITDEALRRPDLDPARTAAMGGSFGGYMANWIATRTDRFRAIVTHASLWHLDAFGGTTDDAYYWLRVLGDPLADRSWIVANSPHLRADRITTPMLVIHGDKDYRVPIGEGIRLYFDLVRHGVTAKFLYFPDENHWVLSPGNSRVWYETVFAFLAEHVLGDRWRRPELL